MNSTELLTVIKALSGPEHTPSPDIDIALLQTMTGEKMPALISLLTELEKRDSIKINITPSLQPNNEIQYKGTISINFSPLDDRNET